MKAGDSIKDLTLDILHHNHNLNVELNSLRKQAQELEKQILELEAKSEITPEEKQKHDDLLSSFLAIQEQFEAYENLPGRLLALAGSDERFSEISKLFLDPNLNSEGIVRIGEILKELYTKAASDKIVLSGDSELQTLYNEIRRGYLSVSAPKTRMNFYFDTKMEESGNIDNINDAPEGSNWEIVRNTINGETDEDVWFTEYLGDPSQLHDDIEGFLNTFIDNFGLNNQIAMNAYNNIVNTLKARTNLTDEQIQEFLGSVLPKIGDQSIVQFMRDIDALRANVTYSPIAALLKDF